MVRRSSEPVQADRGDNAADLPQDLADEQVKLSDMAAMEILEEVLDAAEAARMLGLTRQHVVLLLQRGRLPGKRLTATWITTRKSVEDYARNRRPPGRPPRSVSNKI